MLKWLSILLFACTSQLLAHDGKILVMTIPKAGTCLTEKAVTLLMGEPIGAGLIPTYFSSDDFAGGFPNLTTTAHLIPQFDGFRTAKGVKKILVIRDLRDLSISATFWLQTNDWFSRIIDHTPFYMMDFEHQLNYMIDFPKQHIELGIKGFAKRAIRWMNTPDVLTIRFEDLVGERGGGSELAQRETLKQIADHLEIKTSQEIIDYIVHQLWGEGRTFRKGKINTWKEVFSEEQKALFKETMGQELIDLGYETDYNW